MFYSKAPQSLRGKILFNEQCSFCTFCTMNRFSLALSAFFWPLLLQFIIVSCFHCTLPPGIICVVLIPAQIADPVELAITSFSRENHDGHVRP